MKKYIILLTTVIITLACGNNNDLTSEDEVQIRLSNNSTEKFENATFNGKNFGDLESGETSEYKLYKKAYSYGAVSIDINGKNYGWIPIDFVGEKTLKKGKYTFEYSFDSQTETLVENLVRD